MLTEPAGTFAHGSVFEHVSGAPHGARRATRPVQRAIEFIETYFSQPVSLATLAATAELSVSRFAALFRAEVGISPHRYICLVRVHHAQRLLCCGLPPSAVATEVGFFDQSHLARHFKRQCGMTPAVFAQRHAG